VPIVFLLDPLILLLVLLVALFVLVLSFCFCEYETPLNFSREEKRGKTNGAKPLEFPVDTHPPTPPKR